MQSSGKPWVLEWLLEDPKWSRLASLDCLILLPLGWLDCYYSWHPWARAEWWLDAWAQCFAGSDAVTGSTYIYPYLLLGLGWLGLSGFLLDELSLTELLLGCAWGYLLGWCLRTATISPWTTLTRCLEWLLLLGWLLWLRWRIGLLDWEISSYLLGGLLGIAELDGWIDFLLLGYLLLSWLDIVDLLGLLLRCGCKSFLLWACISSRLLGYLDWLGRMSELRLYLLCPLLLLGGFLSLAMLTLSINATLLLAGILGSLLGWLALFFLFFMTGHGIDELIEFFISSLGRLILIPLFLFIALISFLFKIFISKIASIFILISTCLLSILVLAHIALNNSSILGLGDHWWGNFPILSIILLRIVIFVIALLADFLVGFSIIVWFKFAHVCYLGSSTSSIIALCSNFSLALIIISLYLFNASKLIWFFTLFASFFLFNDHSWPHRSYLFTWGGIMN